MLQDCPTRPWSLKQRILGRHGHLSNDAAANAVEQIVSAHLRHLYLGHLSRECNRPDLALRVVPERLLKIGASHVRVELTSQREPCPMLTFSGPEPEPQSPAAVLAEAPGPLAPPAGVPVQSQLPI